MGRIRTRIQVLQMALFLPDSTRSGQTVRSSFDPQSSISFMRRVGFPQMSQDMGAHIPCQSERYAQS